MTCPLGICSIRLIWKIFLLCAFLGLGIQVSGQKSKEELSNSRKKLEDEIQYTTKLLDKTTKTKETSLRDLKLLNNRIKKREALISNISKEIVVVNREIREDNRLIKKQTRELKEMTDEYAKMIYYAHKIMKSQSRLAFIFAADDFNQAYQRLKYYQQYTSYRRKQAERIREAKIALSKQMHSLETTRTEKLKLKESESDEKSHLDREKTQKDQTIQTLSKKEKQLLASLRTKRAAVKKLQAEIERIIAEEARAREANAANRNPEAVAAELRLSSTFAANKGKLPWPTERGVVTSTFGEHQHPVLKYVKVNNNGIDIMVSRNTQVKAVFNGTVSRILSVPSLNKVVIIRHGEYLTVYTNLDEVNVVSGQSVSTQQVIGKAHYDPDEGKSELNFQIWKGKAILNPQPWLSSH